MPRYSIKLFKNIDGKPVRIITHKFTLANNEEAEEMAKVCTDVGCRSELSQMVNRRLQLIKVLEG